MFDKDCPVISNGGNKSRQLRLSHIHNVERHFALPNVVISLQIICLPLDSFCISTHSSTIFPSVLTAPNFIALCQSGLEITVTDTHPAHFREIISMLSVWHVATQLQSLVRDHYQKLLPLWPGYFIPAIQKHRKRSGYGRVGGLVTCQLCVVVWQPVTTVSFFMTSVLLVFSGI